MLDSNAEKMFLQNVSGYNKRNDSQKQFQLDFGGKIKYPRFASFLSKLKLLYPC